MSLNWKLKANVLADVYILVQQIILGSNSVKFIRLLLLNPLSFAQHREEYQNTSGSVIITPRAIIR